MFSHCFGSLPLPFCGMLANLLLVLGSLVARVPSATVWRLGCAAVPLGWLGHQSCEWQHTERWATKGIGGVPGSHKRCLSGSGIKLWICRLWPGPQQSGSIDLIYNLKILDINEITRRECAMAQAEWRGNWRPACSQRWILACCQLYQSRGTYADCACWWAS